VKEIDIEDWNSIVKIKRFPKGRQIYIRVLTSVADFLKSTDDEQSAISRFWKVLKPLFQVFMAAPFFWAYCRIIDLSISQFEFWVDLVIMNLIFIVIGCCNKRLRKQRRDYD